ncbi:MAG: hypothetical protein ABIM99_02430 [Candidatus Dojkabacteria bacterium]
MDTAAFFALRDAEVMKPQIDIIDENLRFQEILVYLKNLVSSNTINRELIYSIYDTLESRLKTLGSDLSIDLVNDLLFIMIDSNLVKKPISNAKGLFEIAYILKENYINSFDPSSIDQLEMIELERFKKAFFDRRVVTVYDTLDTAEDNDHVNLKLVERRITIIESNKNLENKISFLKSRIAENNFRAIYLVSIEINELVKTLSTDIDEIQKLRLIEILNTLPENSFYNDTVSEILERYNEDELTEG